MTSVLQDTNKFFTLLLQRYNIQMIENKRSPQGINFIGQGYSLRGEMFGISVFVKVNTTEVRIFKIMSNSKVCVFQKNYSTLTDKYSLSKSVSVFKFLDKVLY